MGRSVELSEIIDGGSTQVGISVFKVVAVLIKAIN